MKIIIVEDEPAIARGIAKLLTITYKDIIILDVCLNGSEGMMSILKNQPDLVFTDIRMPVMDGLEMIRQIHEKNFFPQFVILTVYAEFEYARTTMNLGVKDYLLKPISVEPLRKIIDSSQKQISKTTRILQEDYLKRIISFNNRETSDKNPLLACNCTFMILFTGSLCNNIYTETILHSPLQPASREQIQKLENTFQVSIIVLAGRHYNECIYAVIAPCSSTMDLDDIAQNIYSLHDNSEETLNLVISNTCTDGRELFSIRQEAYLYALFHIRFGCSRIFHIKSETDTNIAPSPEIRQICSNLGEYIKRQKISDCLRSMTGFWNKNKVTQFQLVTDLHYFFSTLEQLPIQSHGQLISNIDEIIGSCQTYSDLEKTILDEVNQYLGYADDFARRDQQTLAKQVKEWLDENFTTQITYKIFQDLFNLNEKYISTLFKAEYNITPSRYVGELRLNMAKNLMQNNPEIRVKDVAELVGFTDYFYFSRVFKSHEGITPSQYIKSISNTDSAPETE